MSDTLGAAHDYLRRGWRVVPLHGVTEDGFCRCRAGRTCPPKNAGKHPSLGRAWHERALTSGPDVQAWWDDHPHDNLGVLTGPDSGIFVFDVDGAAGVRSLTAMADEHGAFPATRIVRTGSGGLHYYFTHPGHFTVHGSTSWLAPGIDIRGAAGQVVAPPSRSGLGPYEVIADHDPAPAPEWLLTALAEHSRHIEQGQRAEVAHAERVDVELMPPAVETLRSTLVGVDEGRHKHFHALVAACFENGYTQGQAVTIAAPWCAAVGKFVGRVEQEVARSWAKLLASAERAEEWLPGSTHLSGVKGVVGEATPPAAHSPAGEPTSAPGPPLDSGASDMGEVVEELPATWAAVDLEPILDGTWTPELPTLFPRIDGPHLLYAGRVHSFHGESESGKSLIAQAECARLVEHGGRVAFLDFESDAGAVVSRLLELGATPHQLRTGFEYRRPDTDPRRFPHERAEFMTLAAQPWDLIVIDGMTDALGVWGAGSNDNDEIAAFMRSFPRLLARRTGAAVVLVDHVTKDSDSRGRFAVGGQAKMNALDGAAYTVAVTEALGRGLRGVVTLHVAKDRPGGVRPHCGIFDRNRTQEAARIVVDSTAGDGIQVTVEAPATHVGETPKPFRPTHWMEEISRLLEEEPMSRKKLAMRLGEASHPERIQPAIDVLGAEQYITDNDKGGAAFRYVSSTPYRADEDPQSDTFLGGFAEPRNDRPMRPMQTDAGPMQNRSNPSDAAAPHPEGGAASVEAPLNARPMPSDAEQDPDLLVSCPRCFGPTTAAAMAKWGGACWKCSRAAGVEPPT